MAFIPLNRVEEGQRLVWGTLDETPDRDGECFDYASSKPHFEAWSAALKEASGGRNLGNLREMHTRAAAGGLVDIQFDDANKRIALCGRVVDDAAWAKVQAGVYTGFSPGGRLDRFTRGSQRRYTAKPTELSLVDLPANPSATFTMVKAAGGEESIAFVATPADDADPVAVAEGLAGATTRLDYAGAVLALGAGTLAKLWGASDDLPDDVRLEKRAFSSAERKKLAKDGKALPDGSFPIETKADLEAAVHAFGRAKDKDAAKAHIIQRAKDLDATDLLPADWAGSTKKPDETDAQANNKPMAKGLGTVADLSALLGSLAWLAESVTAEAAGEADGSPLPGLLADWIAQGAEILTGMASEESSEAVGRLRAAVTALPALEAGGSGTADALADGMAKRASHAVARMAKLAGEMAGLREDLAAQTTRNAELARQMTALAAQPATPKGVLRAIDKAHDLGIPAEDTAEDAAIAAMPEGFEKALALHKQTLRRAQRTH